jgi:hypothetical protein
MVLCASSLPPKNCKHKTALKNLSGSPKNSFMRKYSTTKPFDLENSTFNLLNSKHLNPS